MEKLNRGFAWVYNPFSRVRFSTQGKSSAAPSRSSLIVLIINDYQVFTRNPIAED